MPMHACARVQTALPGGGEHDRRNAESGALREVFCVRKVFVKEFKELEKFFELGRFVKRIRKVREVF